MAVMITTVVLLLLLPFPVLLNGNLLVQLSYMLTSSHITSKLVNIDLSTIFHAEFVGRSKYVVRFPLQAWSGSWGSRRLRLLDRLDIWHYEGEKVVTLTHRPPSPSGVFLVLIFRGWIDPRAHGSVGSFGKNPQRHHRGSIPRSSD
jgi:hypothetical protein